MLCGTSILVLTAAIFFTYWGFNYYTKRRAQYKYVEKMDGPLSLPFLGSALQLSLSVQNSVNNIISMSNYYKSPWKLWLGGQLFIVLNDPENVEIVLKQCLQKTDAYKFTEIILGEGLFTAPADKWKRHRKIISNTFNAHILDSYVDIFSQHSLTLIEALRAYVGKGVFEIFPLMAQSSLEVMCETIMGTRINKSSERITYVRTLSSSMNIIYLRLLRYWLHPNLIWKMTSQSKLLDHMSDELKVFVKNVITQKRKEYYKKKSESAEICEGRTRKGFLDHLIEICDTTDNMSNEELREETQNMAAAGGDALGSTPSFVLVMLGMHPLVQEKVNEELESIFGDSVRDITADDLLKMVYLEQVIKETLRLFPVAIVIARRINKDIELKSHTIPGGSECMIQILHIHRNAEIWKDPLKFDPDRFLPEEIAKRHPYSYIPFSAGPRNCIGFKYAMMYMKTVIASVIRNFRITTDFKTVAEIEPEPGVVFKSSVGYRVALENKIVNKT